MSDKRICVPIIGPSHKEALDQLSRAGCRADLVELRLDLLEPTSLSAEMVTVGLNEGGELEGRPYVAFHCFEGVPEDLDALLADLRRQADLVKIAVTPRSTAEAFRFLLWARLQTDLIAVGMGEYGLPTRLLTPFTFGALDSPVAPGQLTLDELDLYRYKAIGDKTQLFGLIGEPLRYLIGRKVHNTIFHLRGLDAVYLPMPVGKGEVGEFLESIAEFNFRGLSVTMPLKEEIAAYLQRLAPCASMAGSVNTLVWNDGWVGYNTDGAGALDAIEVRRKVKGESLLVVGAGGVGRAIAAEAVARGADVTITNRTFERAKKVADMLGCKAVEKPSGGWSIIVQATSEALSELPITDETVVLDVDLEAPHLGTEMWINQAVRQLDLWFGINDGELHGQVTRTAHE